MEQPTSLYLLAEVEGEIVGTLTFTTSGLVFSMGRVWNVRLAKGENR